MELHSKGPAHFRVRAAPDGVRSPKGPLPSLGYGRQGAAIFRRLYGSARSQINEFPARLALQDPQPLRTGSSQQ